MNPAEQDALEAILPTLSTEGAAIARAVIAQPNLSAGSGIDITTSDYDLAVLSEGVISAQICTRLSSDEAVAVMCRDHAAGTSGGWVLSTDENCAPVSCAHHSATHTHYVLYC